MRRRGFLKAFLALAVVPMLPASAEIVQDEVIQNNDSQPVHEPEPTPVPEDTTYALGNEDFTVEIWSRSIADNQYHHYVVVSSNGKITEYVDGIAVKSGTHKQALGFHLVGNYDEENCLVKIPSDGNIRNVQLGFDYGSSQIKNIANLRVTSLARNPETFLSVYDKYGSERFNV